MSISSNLTALLSEIPSEVKLIAVSKYKSNEQILEAYHAGQRAFGENLAQELVKKHETLPKDIEWHLIGHLQTNKVKYIAPFVSLIHSVDSLKLLQEINKRAAQNKRVIDCLLQIHVAKEETKFGLSYEEAEAIFHSEELKTFQHIRIAGLMGMATNTENTTVIRSEFLSLKNFFRKIADCQLPAANSSTSSLYHCQLHTLSMGMSSDYKIAIAEGSTMIRVGSVIFGER